MKTSASLVDIASLASKAPLVSLDTKWNVLVPRIMRKNDDSQKTGNQRDACDSCVGFDGFDGSDGFDGVDGDGTALRWRILRSETLVYASEVLAVMRWICHSGETTVVYMLGQNTPIIWLCSSTKLAREADGSRSSRRVDDVKVEKELMGRQIWVVVVTKAWVASMASMVWKAQGGTDVEVPLVPIVWRRWVALMVGVDVGLGSSTQRALTWKSLCVTSTDGDTHS